MTLKDELLEMNRGIKKEFVDNNFYGILDEGLKIKSDLNLSQILSYSENMFIDNIMKPLCREEYTTQKNWYQYTEYQKLKFPKAYDICMMIMNDALERQFNEYMKNEFGSTDKSDKLSKDEFCELLQIMIENQSKLYRFIKEHKEEMIGGDKE